MCDQPCFVDALPLAQRSDDLCRVVKQNPREELPALLDRTHDELRFYIVAEKVQVLAGGHEERRHNLVDGGTVHVRGQLANSTKAAAPAQQEELEGEVHRVHPEAAQWRRALADQKLQLDTQAEQIRELDKAVAEAQRKIADTCHRAERAEARAQAAERGKLTLQKHHSEGAAVQPRPDAKEEREYMHELTEQVCSAAFDYREHIY